MKSDLWRWHHGPNASNIPSMAEDQGLDIANLLSAAMLLAALLAAVYASRSAKEARRQADAAERAVAEARSQSLLAKASLQEAQSQNRISLHHHQLEAYKAVLQFKARLVGGGIQFKEDAVWPLWEHARLAEFYFSSAIARPMSSLVDEALEIQASRALWAEGADVPSDKRGALINASHEQFKNLQRIIEELESDMRVELKLVRPET